MGSFTPSSPFEITRRDPAGNASALLATAAIRGTPLGVSASDPESFIPAGPQNFVGFLTRDVVVGGLALADRIFGRTTPTPTGLAGPFATGDQVTVEKAHEVEIEGSVLLMTSGVLAVQAGTAVGTQLTFINGQVALAQSGQVSYFTLTANNLTSSDGTSLRIRMEKI